MTRIKVVAETEKTVTLRRSDFRALLAAAEDNLDVAAVHRHRAHEEAMGWDAARRDYLTREESDRLLDGESPVRVWREKRGMTQRALAEAARVAPGYLAEIEAGRKPGSKDALLRIADVLELPVERLMRQEASAEGAGLRPVTRSEAAASRLEKLAVSLAKHGVDRDRMADEVRSVLREWLEIADRDRVRHQIKAAIWSLRTLVTEMSVKWSRSAQEQERTHDIGAARRSRRISECLEAAIDALGSESRRL